MRILPSKENLCTEMYCTVLIHLYLYQSFHSSPFNRMLFIQLLRLISTIPSIIGGNNSPIPNAIPSHWIVLIFFLLILLPPPALYGYAIHKGCIQYFINEAHALHKYYVSNGDIKMIDYEHIFRYSITTPLSPHAPTQF